MPQSEELVVDRFPGDLMIGVKHPLAQQVPYMSAAQLVQDSATVAGAFHQTGKPQLRQVLTGHRRSAPGRRGQAGHIQAVVVVLSGSIALLGDTLHNVADALTAVPLLIAFTLVRRPPNKRYTYGYGRAEDIG